MDSVYGAVESNREALYDLTQRLWGTPELGLHEEESSAILVDVLEREGFDVETGVGGMPTAFVATYGDGSPRIGILGEYDALPNLSQKVKAERDPVEEGAPGHGCGHNLFGTAAVGAAIALKDAIEEGEVSGTVVCYGCPAEEILAGKIYMARDGVFDDLDAALTWHPGVLNIPRLGSTNALNSILYTFEGTSAHGGVSPEAGRSALDAVQLMNMGAEYIREHMIDEARLNYVITDGGDAPNIVPASAAVWYYIRAPTRSKVEELTARLDNCAEGAALMTGTELANRRVLSGCYDLLVNETIAGVIRDRMEELGPTGFDEEDREFAAELQATMRAYRLSNLPEEGREEILEHALYDEPVKAFDRETRNNGSTDVADVSHIVPVGTFHATANPVGTAPHSWQAVAANGSFGKKGAVYAAKVIAGTAFELMTSPETLNAAREEFERETGGADYESPLPPDAEPPFFITERQR